MWQKNKIGRQDWTFRTPKSVRRRQHQQLQYKKILAIQKYYFSTLNFLHHLRLNHDQRSRYRHRQHTQHKLKSLPQEQSNYMCQVY
jgi:hypothetical protein